MKNVISLCDYRQRKIEEDWDARIEDEWNMLDNVITSILISEKARVVSVLDKCDTTTITLTLFKRSDEDTDK